jgi:hypothetical protein
MEQGADAPDALAERVYGAVARCRLEPEGPQ